MAGAPRIQLIHRFPLFRDSLLVALSKRYAIMADDELTVPLDETLVVLLDAQLPIASSGSILERLNEFAANRKLILLVDDHLHHVPPEMLDLGIHGFVPKSSTMQQLEAAIDRVAAGDTFCSKELMESMFLRLAATSRVSAPAPPVQVDMTRLTTREREVLELIGQHQSNKQIAKRLGVSLHTVKNHVHNILEKLNVDSRLAAIDHARRRA